ncbi:MAG: hypothetical protein Q8R35_01940 [bacterium]|nr:hypothetical protein [bacterium]
MSTVEASLQEMARELGINYYAFFRVLATMEKQLELYFPLAETYEGGRWRPVVISGRPYHESSIAQGIVEEAEKAQETFLRDMTVVRNVFGLPFRGLTNPIDHWRPHLDH